jgi:hypothetical protein
VRAVPRVGAGRARDGGAVMRPVCSRCDRPWIASGGTDACVHCNRGMDDHDLRCVFCDGTGERDEFVPSCCCDDVADDEEEVSEVA